MTNLEKYLYHLRRIEAHRKIATEKQVRKIYKKLLKELQAYLSDIYIKYSEDDALTYSDLAKAGMDARFLEEVELRISGMSTTVANEINNTVSQTYEACYNGMKDAVAKAAGSREVLQQAFAAVSAVTPDVIKAAVNNPVSGLTLKDTLEKHRKDVIYDIKQNIGVGLVNGDRYTTMAKRISKSLDGDYKKSIRIVRTEAHRVRESGFNDAATDINNALKNGQSGYVMAKTWRTMDDERVRPRRQKRKTYNHVKMDGVTIPQDELFELPSGATCMCPGKTGVAGEDINCRCYLSYDLVEVGAFVDGDVSGLQEVKSSDNIDNKYSLDIEKQIKEDGFSKISDERYDEYIQRHRNSITEEVRSQIYGYDWDNFKGMNPKTGYFNSSDASVINSFLRKGNEQYLMDSEKRTVEMLKGAIEKNTVSDNFVAQRYVDVNWFSDKFSKEAASCITHNDYIGMVEELKKIENRKELFENQFASISLKEDNVYTDRKIKLTLEIPSGTHTFVSENRMESEAVLYKPRYEFIGIRENSNAETGELQIELLLKVVGDGFDS